MSALAFLVRGRSVDLVAMTALHALRDTLGLGDEVVALTRDDVVVIEGLALGDAARWTAGFTAQQHWFNPNKHRFAAVEVADGALACARPDAKAVAGADAAWPHDWMRALRDTDRPDLLALKAAGTVDDVLRAWIGGAAAPGHYAVPLVAWDRESGVDALPAGPWPDPALPRLRAVLWTLTLKAGSASAAAARAQELAVTRARRHGLLIHPHMEGFATAGPPRALEPSRV